MLFGEKNDGGIELHLEPGERRMLHRALRHYLAFAKDSEYVIDDVPAVCELMNVLVDEADTAE